MKRKLTLNVVVVNYPDLFFSYSIRALLSAATGKVVKVNNVNLNETEVIKNSDVAFIYDIYDSSCNCYFYPYINSGHCLIVGITRKIDAFKSNRLTPCMGIFSEINIKSSLDSYKYLFEEINSRIGKINLNRRLHVRDVCTTCKKRSPSKKQLLFCELFMEGASISDMASKLNCKPKTVYSYKSQLKTKYNIKTDQEIYMLLKKM